MCNTSAAFNINEAVPTQTKTIFNKFNVKRGSLSPKKTPKMAGNKNSEPKIQLGAWHPKENTFAVVKHNALFVYSENRGRSARS